MVKSTGKRYTINMRPEHMMEQFYTVPFVDAVYVYMFTDESYGNSILVKVIEND